MKGDSKEAAEEKFPGPNQDIMYIIEGLGSYDSKKNKKARNLRCFHNRVHHTEVLTIVRDSYHF